MFFLQVTGRQLALRLLFSLGLSLLVLGLLVQGTLNAADQALLPRLLQVLTTVSPFHVSLYLVASLFQATLRAWRYLVLLRAAEPGALNMGHILLVTLSRNMFVDMLPARLGELSYIAMLNQGYRVGSHACISSLAISFIFDLLALALLLVALLGYQAGGAGIEPWLVSVVLVLGMVVFILLLGCFPLLRKMSELLSKCSGTAGGLSAKFFQLLKDIAAAFARTREAGVTLLVLVLSLGVRLGKYYGLYALFNGIIMTCFEGFSLAPVKVVAALVGAEAAASLPVPAFMSFGAYEAGGVLTLAALGIQGGAVVVIMLCLHILSQIIDYSLGGAALVAFMFTARRREKSLAMDAQPPGWRRPLPILVGLVLMLAGMALVASQVRGLKKKGVFAPPASGQAVQGGEGAAPLGAALTELRGFVVWSSNRHGSHDILKMTLPGRAIERLTTDSHTEYFPRISPDGSTIVYSRSREPWVSQRNDYPWDVYLLDLHTGESRRLAEFGNTPTWSEDGKRIFFQRNGNQFVEYQLATNRESMVFESGKNPHVPAEVLLTTPGWSDARQAMAATFRGDLRATAIVDWRGKVSTVADGCQLTWGPGGQYLYQVDHGGKGVNAFYRVDANTLKRTFWFDSPSEYSHEYFPKVDGSGLVMVYGASISGHEHDRADYEIFLWRLNDPPEKAARLTFHTGNDCWPDVYLGQVAQ